MYIACQSSRCGLILHNLVADYQTARVAATFFDTGIISWKAKSIGKNVIDVLGVIDWVYAKLMRINVMLFQSDMIWKIIGVRYQTWVYNFRESDGTEVTKTYNICGSYLYWNLIMIGKKGRGSDLDANNLLASGQYTWPDYLTSSPESLRPKTLSPDSNPNFNHKHSSSWHTRYVRLCSWQVLWWLIFLTYYLSPLTSVKYYGDVA